MLLFLFDIYKHILEVATSKLSFKARVPFYIPPINLWNFVMIAILVGVKKYLILAFIFISLLNNVVEHLFLFLLAVVSVFFFWRQFYSNSLPTFNSTKKGKSILSDMIVVFV